MFRRISVFAQLSSFETDCFYGLRTEDINMCFQLFSLLRHGYNFFVVV